MNVNKIIRYSMQLAILKQLKLKNMITEEEYEKILRAIRKDYQVISDVSVKKTFGKINIEKGSSFV